MASYPKIHYVLVRALKKFLLASYQKVVDLFLQLYFLMAPEMEEVLRAAFGVKNAKQQCR